MAHQGFLADAPDEILERIFKPSGVAVQMLFGHNSDVKVGDSVYHIQTEDRGTATALIDTTVYAGGRVVHRRTNNYADLLPLDPARESSLRKRIDDQHRGIVEELRGGTLKVATSAAPAKASQPATPAQALSVELLNAKSWLSGKHASLQIAVRQSSNGAVAGAKVIARVEGSADGSEYAAQAGPDGLARIEFDMPRLASAEPALVIEASHGASKAQLKFQLRARPRVPSA